MLDHQIGILGFMIQLEVMERVLSSSVWVKLLPATFYTDKAMLPV